MSTRSDSPTQTHSLPRVNYSAIFTGEDRALQLLQSAAPLESVLTALVQTLEAALEKTVVGSILLVEPATNRLRHGAAPSLPDIYNRTIDGIAIGDYGTCCAAAHRNEIVVTPDIEHDSGWAKLKDYPLAIRLRGAWSCPIRGTDGRVLGTFGTYFHECREPTETERELVTMLARTAAIAIEQRAKTATAAPPSLAAPAS